MDDFRPTPKPAQVNNLDHSNAAVITATAAVVVTALPGALIGAAIASVMWRFIKPDTVSKWLIAGLGLATVAALNATVVIAWPVRALLAQWVPAWSVGVTEHTVLLSVPVELSAGPAALVLFEWGTHLWKQTIHGQEWERYRAVADRKKALERHWPGPSPVGGPMPPGEGLLLGTVAEDGGPFEIGAAELAQHVFVPGASGTGKTTTLVTLADGALSNGYGVVIIDCKGSGLGGEARKLAARHDIAFTVVDPKDRKSVGYDPCSGDAAAVANKLIGAFQFTGEAEIYKQVAMEVIPLICRALEASGTQVTLDEIYQALDRGGLGRLGRRDGADAYRARLEDLEDAGGVGAAGYAGLQRRLGALMEGTFGDLFRKRPALDWQKQLRQPKVTYLSLSATAAGEDVELFGRVITQDLKQVCDERMRAIDRGKDVTPVLIIYDEFAALREATQIVDLLLQARQAKAPLVVATQFLPEEIPILRPVMSAGILIAHRLEAEDAEKVAQQFGTHTVPMLTAQVDYETGKSQKGSARWVEEFNVHPNVLKELPVGVAAVYARPTHRRKIVKVAKLND